MRIGIDARLWSQTGVGRYIRNLIYNLQVIDKQNDYVLFVMDRDYDDVKFRISNLKFKISNCNIRWHTLSEQLNLPSILNKEKLDLIHFPYISVPFFYNKPFVVTIHDLIPYHFSTGKASTLPFPFYKFKFLAYKLIVSQAAKKAKKIIVPSSTTKKDIIDYLKVDPSKVQVVYEGTDESLIRRSTEEKKEYFLYIGNAYPHKNLEFLLNTFKDLPSDFKIILVGKKDYFYRRLEQKAKEMHLEEKIDFFGEASDSQLSSLYKEAKALIIPSFIEGFGLPALEAMANECLVIASDIPTLHEVGGDAAIYFNPNNIDDLTQKLNQVYFNTALYYSENIRRGLKRAREFSWKKTAEETLRIYNDFLIDRM